ncbi:hypothetical protein PR048_003746 [Dryococelus australis]|uniref:Uncharacterized protein n=1 Tax=Dryococelus australis TaxID=614101 RepID=A0ABQ9IPT9_9NEOP|nr:hypothetical protein PR048_003746 [Dryococelus australis]
MLASDVIFLTSGVTLLASDAILLAIEVVLLASDAILLASDVILLVSDVILLPSDVILLVSDTILLPSDSILLTSAVLLASEVILLASDAILLASDTFFLASEVILLASDAILLASEVVVLASNAILLACAAGVHGLEFTMFSQCATGRPSPSPVWAHTCVVYWPEARGVLCNSSSVRQRHLPADTGTKPLAGPMPHASAYYFCDPGTLLMAAQGGVKPRSQSEILTHRNGRARETRDPREDPPTNAIARHDSHVRKSGGDRVGNRTWFAQVGGKRAARSGAEVGLSPMTVACLPQPSTILPPRQHCSLPHAKDKVDGSLWLHTTNLRVPTLNCSPADTSSEHGDVWIVGTYLLVCMKKLHESILSSLEWWLKKQWIIITPLFAQGVIRRVTLFLMDLKNWVSPKQGRGGVVVRLLASHIGEPGSIPGGFAYGSSHVGIEPDDTTGRQVFSGMSHFPRPCIPSVFRYLAPPSSALKISMLRSAHFSPISNQNIEEIHGN